MTAAVLERVEERTTQPGDAEAAHIVKTEPGENASAKVLEARIYGYPVEALCGHTFVPQRNPQVLPICEECKDIYAVYKAINNLYDRPAE